MVAGPAESAPKIFRLDSQEASEAKVDALTARLPVIQSTLEALRKVCDNVGFVFSPESTTRVFVVRMAFDTNVYFEEFTAKQLGVDRKRPIIVQLEVQKNKTWKKRKDERERDRERERERERERRNVKRNGLE